jgi:ribosome-associated translation inhibitor RaiA
MKPRIRSHNISLEPPLRALIERAVELAFWRYRSRIHWVEVALTDVNGPRGGSDVECRLAARGPGVMIRVHQRCHSPTTASRKALSLVRRALDERGDRRLRLIASNP